MNWQMWDLVKIMEGWMVFSVVRELLLIPATTVSEKTSYSQVVCIMLVVRD